MINGELKTVDELSDIFLYQGVDFEWPVIVDYGSGVTAVMVVLIFIVFGMNSICLYGDFRSEWGMRSNLSVKSTSAAP